MPDRKSEHLSDRLNAEKMSEWMPDTMLKQYVTVGITRSTVILVETNLPPPICQGLCLFTGGYVRKKHLFLARIPMLLEIGEDPSRGWRADSTKNQDIDHIAESYPLPNVYITNWKITIFNG